MKVEQDDVVRSHTAVMASVQYYTVSLYTVWQRQGRKVYPQRNMQFLSSFLIVFMHLLKQYKKVKKCKLLLKPHEASAQP